MSKLIIALFALTFSLASLANESLNSPYVVEEIESIIESKIDKHQDYMDKKLTKSIEINSKKMILESISEIENMK